MSIFIYPPTATDFTTNGLGQLFPIECAVEEQAGGMCELTLTHPIDDTLRWTLITPGCVVKAPAPVRETPLYEAPAVSEPITVKRRLWQVERTTHGAYLRSGPGTSYARLAIKRNGDRVLELEDCGDPWIKVCVVNGGAVGYMSTKWLGLIGETEEIISPGTPTGGTVRVTQSRHQLFRVRSVERDSARRSVTARASHIFYDAADHLILGNLNPAGQDISAVIPAMNALLADCPVRISCPGLTGPVSGDYGWRNPVEALLDPDSGMAAQTGALLIRDNFEAFLIPDRIRDRGVTIRRGKNLVGLRSVSDNSNAATRILPVGRNAAGGPLYIEEVFVDSPRPHDRTRTRRIEYDVQEGDGLSAAAARAELRRRAQSEFDKNGLDLPASGMEVDFTLPDPDGEYAGLQAVHLYDTVTVIDETLLMEAKLRVTACRFDCLSLRYSAMTLGELIETQERVNPWALPDSGVPGTKIAPGSLSGAALRSATIQYANISNAAVEQLSAGAITALTARIGEIVADKLSTDALCAAFAELIALKAGDITADNIETDALAAQLARVTVLSAGSAAFDRATVQHLVSQAMNLEYGAAGQLFIKNLSVEYAQLLGAAVGQLCVKASDGAYYLLDVNPDGSVTATKTTVTDGEITSGATEGGRVILETDITASNLSASTLQAACALVNRIDAARIDADQLFAREAFLDKLRTTGIVGDKSITIIAREAEDALAEAQGIQLGGRNLVVSSKMQNIKGDSTASFTVARWGGTWLSAANTRAVLTPGETYTLSYEAELVEKCGLPKFYSGNAGFRVDCPSLPSAAVSIREVIPETAELGYKMRLTRTFTVPDPIPDDYKIIVYSRRWTEEDGTGPAFDTVRFTNVKLEKGNRPTDWTPAPEDVDAAVAAAQSAADSAMTAASAAVSRAEQQHYLQARPDGLYVGLLEDGHGRARVRYNSFDVLRPDGSVSNSLGDARQDLGTLTIYTTAEGHTAFIPREV